MRIPACKQRCLHSCLVYGRIIWLNFRNQQYCASASGFSLRVYFAKPLRASVLSHAIYPGRVAYSYWRVLVGVSLHALPVYAIPAAFLCLTISAYVVVLAICLLLQARCCDFLCPAQQIIVFVGNCRRAPRPLSASLFLVFFLPRRSLCFLNMRLQFSSESLALENGTDVLAHQSFIALSFLMTTGRTSRRSFASITGWPVWYCCTAATTCGTRSWFVIRQL